MYRFVKKHCSGAMPAALRTLSRLRHVGSVKRSPPERRDALIARLGMEIMAEHHHTAGRQRRGAGAAPAMPHNPKPPGKNRDPEIRLRDSNDARRITGRRMVTRPECFSGMHGCEILGLRFNLRVTTSRIALSPA